MKVIFIKDLRGKGKVNEVKEFSDGYAINYLIKNKYAVRYTESSSKRLDKDLENIRIKEENDIKEANEIKNKLKNIVLKFNVKTGKDGKVFGSISSKQISDELLKKGFNISKKIIKLDSPINTLGFHNVIISLHKKVETELRIEVIEK